MKSSKKSSRNSSKLDNLHYLNAYLGEIREMPVLSRKEEIELAKKIKRGDKKAKDELIQANLKLVVWVARNIIKKKSFERFTKKLPDLIQEGNKALIKAAEKFDWERGNKFSTYAVRSIGREIIRAINKERKNVSDVLPLDAKEDLSKIKRQLDRERIMQKIFNENFLTLREKKILKMRLEEYTLQEIGKEFGLTRERIRQILEKINQKISDNLNKEEVRGIDLFY